MTIPAYWLPRPTLDWSADVLQELEALYEQRVAPGTGDWIEDRLPVPTWAFCCWLCDRKGLLLHGSARPDIAVFEPRTPNDRSADDFSKQTAVFAAADGIWALFYAILDRDRFRLRMLNGALQFQMSPEVLSDMHYFFSVTQDVLRQRPWRAGVIYILPREGFQQQPPYSLGGRIVHEPHWASPSAVRPLAKIRVTPADFPFLDRVRGHDDEEIMRRAAQDPYGFPWLSK